LVIIGLTINNEAVAMDIAQNLAALRAERARTAASLRGWEEAGARGGILFQQRRRLARLDAEIAALQKERDVMDPMTPPNAGMVLRAGTTIRSAELAAACGRTDGVVPRGIAIPIEALAACLNARALISSGALSWTLPVTPRRSMGSAASAPPAPMPAVPTNFIGELRAVAREYIKRGRSWDEAFDLADQALVERALKQYAGRPGQLPGQRSVVGFRQHVQQGAAP
jgi:hypothetical protein